ncbi:hypothetical protein QOZ80_8AG0635490 [Eleusine coracana subsp. coracana]|nr:hypothetical protein QOZ80_8AG0635490 [Eleusine coracana subsp. coracana]
MKEEELVWKQQRRWCERPQRWRRVAWRTGDTSRSFEGFSFSTITVTNPITVDKLELPPAPWKRSQMRSSGKFSFGYHPVTGKHKVVHIPCLRDQAAFKAVQVFTLGDDKAWREVPVLVQASCNLSSEPLSLNGRTYWLTESSDRVMALDLKDERVTSFRMPSVKQTGPIPAGAKWQLTNAHGKPGVVVSAVHPYQAAAERVDVWAASGAAMADDVGSRLPDDLFMRILLPFPMSSRRTLRLVCKLWRDVIDRCTPERHVRTSVLVFKSPCGRDVRAVVFDLKDGSRRHEWTFPCSNSLRCTVELVGTCNGLLCLHETMLWNMDGRFTTVRYGFGYHPITGQYKVVHIPCLQSQTGRSVQVLTLGDRGASWRDVPVLNPAGASYDGRGSVVSVDGTAYWLTACSSRVMALDLEEERVTSFDMMAAAVVSPGPGKERHEWMLTNIHAKLGLVLRTPTRLKVLVLEKGGEQQRQQPRCSQIYDLAGVSLIRGSLISSPHLTHGEYILSAAWKLSPTGKHHWSLYRQKVGNLTGDDSNKRQLRKSEWAEVVMRAEDSTSGLNTFAYVETLEPLPSNLGCQQDVC